MKNSGLIAAAIALALSLGLSPAASAHYTSAQDQVLLSPLKPELLDKQNQCGDKSAWEITLDELIEQTKTPAPLMSSKSLLACVDTDEMRKTQTVSGR